MHFVFACYHYDGDEDKLRPIISNGMKKYKLKSVMVTKLYMRRWKLITKEKMESHSKGEEGVRHDSVNDDLESLFENIRLGKVPDEEVTTYFLPKLTKKELDLVERRNKSYLKLFWSSNPDVDQTEMMHSESDSKYVRGESWRRTFVIENSSEFSYQSSSDNSSENSFENMSEKHSAKRQRTS